MHLLTHHPDERSVRSDPDKPEEEARRANGKIPLIQDQKIERNFEHGSKLLTDNQLEDCLIGNFEHGEKNIHLPRKDAGRTPETHREGTLFAITLQAAA